VLVVLLIWGVVTAAVLALVLVP
jgi:hypothetical protein